jgi:hypothetical protein
MEFRILKRFRAAAEIAAAWSRLSGLTCMEPIRFGRKLEEFAPSR